MSSDKKAVMVFGAGELQKSIISTSKNMELYTIAIDPDPNAVGKDCADVFYQVAGGDYDKTLELAKKYNISGVVTSATDKPLLMMAKIAETLELPFPSISSVMNSIDKYKFKQTLQANNIPCAKGVLINIDSDLDAVIKHNGLVFPLITKPIDNAGSRGVIRCLSMDDLKESIHETFQETSSQTILLEEYLSGDEISIEAVVQDKKLHIIQITDKKTTDFPYNVEISHFQPSKYKAKCNSQLYDLLKKTVEVLGLDNCALHPELKLTKDGWKFIELGPRLGGDYITSDLVLLSTGVNIEELLINICIDRKIEYKIKDSSSEISFFNLESGKSLKALPTDITNTDPSIVKYKFDLKIGDIVPQIKNSLDRYGFVIYKKIKRN